MSNYSIEEFLTGEYAICCSSEDEVTRLAYALAPQCMRWYMGARAVFLDDWLANYDTAINVGFFTHKEIYFEAIDARTLSWSSVDDSPIMSEIVMANTLGWLTDMPTLSDFISGKISVRFNNEEQAKAFLHICTILGLQWDDTTPADQVIPMCYPENYTFYYYDGKNLLFKDTPFTNTLGVPFSNLRV